MKEVSRWWTHHLECHVNVARWGHWGLPVLLFPTAGGDAEEIERMGVIGALWPLIEGGRIKVYSCDSVAGRAWISKEHGAGHCAFLQNQFDAFIRDEVVPAIRTDCRSDEVLITAAGASIGAFNAVAAVCRHPDVFQTAIALSGTYDLEKLFGFQGDQAFDFASPLLFVPHLGEGAQLDLLRHRFILLAFGQGRWESAGESWRMAGVLGGQGVPNRVDPWGPEYDHDWPTWRQMLPHYLGQLT